MSAWLCTNGYMSMCFLSVYVCVRVYVAVGKCRYMYEFVGLVLVLSACLCGYVFVVHDVVWNQTALWQLGFII